MLPIAVYVSYRALTSCLVVIIPVPPKISPFTADRDLHLGERTTLTCSVTRGDLPLSITWLKDGRSMGPSERVTVTNMDQYNSILMIESLSPDHNGNYSCVARNVAAEVSHTQRLVVHGNPPLGPLQFARRPPDRPSFACACVCPLRACESCRPGSKMEAARGSCVSLSLTAIVTFWFVRMRDRSAKCTVNVSFDTRIKARIIDGALPSNP